MWIFEQLNSPDQNVAAKIEAASQRIFPRHPVAKKTNATILCIRHYFWLTLDKSAGSSCPVHRVLADQCPFNNPFLPEVCDMNIVFVFVVQVSRQTDWKLI